MHKLIKTRLMFINIKGKNLTSEGWYERVGVTEDDPGHTEESDTMYSGQICL